MQRQKNTCLMAALPPRKFLPVRKVFLSHFFLLFRKYISRFWRIQYQGACWLSNIMIALNRARPLQLRNTFGFRINFQNQNKVVNCKSQQRNIAYKNLQTGNIAFMKFKTGTQIISILLTIVILSC